MGMNLDVLINRLVAARPKGLYGRIERRDIELQLVQSVSVPCSVRSCIVDALTSRRGDDSRLDKLERCTIRGDERLILSPVRWDLGLAIDPVVKAGKIPEERRVVSRLH